MRVRPCFKQANLGVPLEATSGHAPSVHNWPRSCVARLGSLSTSRYEAEAAKAIFVDKLRTCFASDTRIKMLVETDPWSCTVRTQGPVSNNGQKLWCVLDHHPVYARHVIRTIAKANQCPHLRSLLANAMGTSPPTICISWRNALPSLMQLV